MTSSTYLVLINRCICSSRKKTCWHKRTFHIRNAACCDALNNRKREHYADYLVKLKQNGVRYQPLFFSAYGRAHLETDSVLLSLAVRAARLRGLRDHRPILKRVRKSISVQIWKQATSMVLACLLVLDREEERLLFGCDVVDFEAFGHQNKDPYLGNGRLNALTP